jgi:xylitol oxidase
MNKRTFLKLLLALPARTAWGFAKLTNWAGNFEFSTDRVYDAATLDQVRSLVTAHNKLKVIGTRHCFNRIADSPDGLLSLKSIDDAIQLDPQSKTVTVSAAMTYGKLAPYLQQKGFGLHNLASLPHTSIAGACSTGTHGSGEKNGNLSTAVAALEFVTASGDTLKLSRQKDGDTFRGAVVSLGALGVITRVTLDLQPAYTVQQYVYENLPIKQMADHFDQIQSSAYSVSLFTDWQKGRINEVWLKARTNDAPAFDRMPEFFGARRATRNLHPIAELSAENCTAQLGVPGPWYDRLPHFRMGFTPSAGKELQSEFFVPRRNAVDAILAIERLRDQITPHLLISELRTIAADDLWLSPCYRQPNLAIHFTWKQDWPAVSKLLPVIERELAPYKPRPHWGKLFTISPQLLKSAYVKMPEFVQLCTRHDPKGKFRNDFLNKNIFG